MTGGTPPGSPLRRSELLGREIRQDELERLGVPTPVLAIEAVRQGDVDGAAALADYFAAEVQRANDAVASFLAVVLADRGQRLGAASTDDQAVLLDLLPGFPVSAGDLGRALAAARAGDADHVAAVLEQLRLRLVSVHDLLVWWTQRLLADAARRWGDDVVRDVVLHADEVLWQPRFAVWDQLAPLERLQLSAEQARAHLGGRNRDGRVQVTDEGDRWVLTLDPCGSCGVLRRGDPETGRAPCVGGLAAAHAWGGDRVGYGAYAVHVVLTMQWRQEADDLPARRPVSGCDEVGPCRWYVDKGLESGGPVGGAAGESND